MPLPFLRMLDLARAMSFDPQFLLEITAALPPDLSDVVLDVMCRWKQRDRSVLFISHRLVEVREHCDRAPCCAMAEVASCSSLRTGGERSQSALGEAAAAIRDDVEHREAVRREDAAPQFEVRNLAAGRALHDVSLGVRAGEVLGLAAWRARVRTCCSR